MYAKGNEDIDNQNDVADNQNKEISMLNKQKRENYALYTLENHPVLM